MIQSCVRSRTLITEELVREELERRGRAPGALLAKEQPGYVRACSRNPHRDPEAPPWVAYTWTAGEEHCVYRLDYCCRSWRCEGCRDHERHTLYARMVEGFERVSKRGAKESETQHRARMARETLFLVLTYDSELHDLTRYTMDELYGDLGRRTEAFRKAIDRILLSTCTRCLGHRFRGRCKCGSEKDGDELPPVVGRGFGEYVSTIEAHDNQVPHTNFVIWNPQWARIVDEIQRRRFAKGLRGRRARYIASVQGQRTELDERIEVQLRRLGFGFASTLERPRDFNQVLNYINGIAAHADETATRINRNLMDAQRKDLKKKRDRMSSGQYSAGLAEILKTRQLPMKMPKGGRRHRSSKHLIPPRRKSGRTGTIVRIVDGPGGLKDCKPLVFSARADLRAMQGLLMAVTANIENEGEELAASDETIVASLKLLMQESGFAERDVEDIEALRKGVESGSETRMARRGVRRLVFTRDELAAYGIGLAHAREGPCREGNETALRRCQRPNPFRKKAEEGRDPLEGLDLASEQGATCKARGDPGRESCAPPEMIDSWPGWFAEPCMHERHVSLAQIEQRIMQALEALDPHQRPGAERFIRHAFGAQPCEDAEPWTGDDSPP